MERSRRLAFAAALTVLLLALAGCRPAAPAPEMQPDQQRMMEQDMPDADWRERAQEAENVSETKEGVQNAVAIISAPATVLVGLFLDAGVEAAETQRLERELAEEIPQEVDGVQRALVSSNPDVAQRIRSISEGVAKGRPISEFNDQIRDLVARMTPQMGAN